MRKSTGLLTSYRTDIIDSNPEMIELTIQLDEIVTRLAELSPEQVRSTHRAEHTDLLKQLRKAHVAMGKAIAKHARGSKGIKDFFDF